MKIDLHCHTKVSDGSATAAEVLCMAACNGINVLSITDHDTFSGNNQVQRLAEKIKVKVLPGIEISTFDYQRKKKVHILCYYPNQSSLLPVIYQTAQNRREEMKKVLPIILKAYPMPEEMIFNRAKECESIFKQHVMHALMDAGYADSLFGDVFHKLFGSQGGIARTRVQYPEVREVLNLIQATSGIAIMAHPGEYKSLELLEELMQKQMLSGAELNHPKNSEKDKQVIQEICLHYQKIMTGGTDFHGSYSGRTHPIGSFLTSEHEYEKIEKMSAKHSN